MINTTFLQYFAKFCAFSLQIFARNKNINFSQSFAKNLTLSYAKKRIFDFYFYCHQSSFSIVYFWIITTIIIKTAKKTPNVAE